MSESLTVARFGYCTDSESKKCTFQPQGQGCDLVPSEPRPLHVSGPKSCPSRNYSPRGVGPWTRETCLGTGGIHVRPSSR